MPTFNGSSTAFCSTASSLTGSDTAWGPAAGAALPAPPSGRPPGCSRAGWPRGRVRRLGGTTAAVAASAAAAFAAGLVGWCRERPLCGEVGSDRGLVALGRGWEGAARGLG